MSKSARAQVPMVATGTSRETQQYLTFMVATELFAFGIRHIKEIIEYGHVTQVPMMPRFVRGVINLRGNVVPVVDLSARFNREPSLINKRSCIVIVELENGEGRQDVGVVVDSVCAVLEIDAADIEPPPSFGVRVRTEFIEGMGKVDGKFIILLNMDRVLSLEDVAQLEQLAQSADAALPEDS